MSEEIEGVKAETQDLAVETTETEVEDNEVDSQGDAQVEAEAESEEVEETVEQRLERLEKEAEAKQRKIDRQTAANRKTQELLEQRNRELEAIQQKLEQNAKPESQEPNIDDFETYEEYTDALAKHKAEKLIAEREKENLLKQQREAAQKAMAERESIRAKQEAEYVKINPNYKASKAEFEDFVKTLDVDPAVERFIVDQAFDGNIAQVIDYFGSNGGERLSELEDIAKMSPRKAAIAIYEIQKGFKAPERKETKPLDKPVTKIKATAKTKKVVDDLSQDDFRKWLAS